MLTAVRHELDFGWRLSTGSEQLDQELKGGLLPCSVTEIYGPAGSGKTQLALSLLAAAGKSL